MPDSTVTKAREFYDAHLRADRPPGPTYYHGEIRAIDGGQCIYISPHSGRDKSAVKKILRALAGQVRNAVTLTVVGSDGSRETVSYE